MGGRVRDGVYPHRPLDPAVNEILGGIGLTGNAAAGIWLVYGGAKLWQVLRNGKNGNGNGNGYTKPMVESLGRIEQRLDVIHRDHFAQHDRTRDELCDSVRDVGTATATRIELAIERALRERK